jgi:ferredoxin
LLKGKDMETSAHSIRILNQGKIFFLKEDKHLGNHIASEGCHGGGCGICKIKIISGNFKTSVMSKKYINEEERENGFTLACRVFPLSDLVIKYIGK